MSWRDSFVPEGGPKDGWQSSFIPDTVEPSTSAGQAALEHTQNALLLGYLPQVQAGIDSLLPDPGKEVDEQLRAQGFKIDQPRESYIENRDKIAKRLETERAEHPIASGLGTLGGIVSSAALPLGAAAKGASLVTQAGRGALTGAAMGAIANPGDKEGEVAIPLYDDFDQRAKGALLGGAIGAAAPVAIKGASTAAEKVSDYLRNKAALKATRALGHPGKKLAEKMANTGQDAELGRELLDSGAIPYLGSPKRIASRVEGLKEKAGQEIGDLVESAGSAKVVDAEKLGLEILDSPELAQMRKTPGMENAVSTIEKQVETLASNGQLDVANAQKLRQSIDRSLYKNSRTTEFTGAKEGLEMQRHGLNKAMNEGIEALSPSTGKNALLKANKKYSNMATASDILKGEIGRQQANRAVSLTDTIAGAAGAAHSAPAALALGAANKFGRTFGNSLQARVYDAIAKKAGLAPGALEKVNPQVASLITQRISRGTPGLERDNDPILKDQKLMELFKKDPSLIDAIDDEHTKSKVKRAIASGGSK